MVLYTQKTNLTTTSLNFVKTSSPPAVTSYGGYGSAQAQSRALQREIEKSRKENPDQFKKYSDKNLQYVKTKISNPNLSNKQVVKQISAPQKIEVNQPVNLSQVAKSSNINVPTLTVQKQNNNVSFEKQEPLDQFVGGFTSTFEDYGGVLDPNYKSKSPLNQGIDTAIEGIMTGKPLEGFQEAGDIIYKEATENPAKFAGAVLSEAGLAVIPIGPALKAVKGGSVAFKLGVKTLSDPKVIQNTDPTKLKILETSLDALKQGKADAVDTVKAVVKDIQKSANTVTGPLKPYDNVGLVQQTKEVLPGLVKTKAKGVIDKVAPSSTETVKVGDSTMKVVRPRFGIGTNFKLIDQNPTMTAAVRQGDSSTTFINKNSPLLKSKSDLAKIAEQGKIIDSRQNRKYFGQQKSIGDSVNQVAAENERVMTRVLSNHEPLHQVFNKILDPKTAAKANKGLDYIDYGSIGQKSPALKNIGGGITNNIGVPFGKNKEMFSTSRLIQLENINDSLSKSVKKRNNAFNKYEIPGGVGQANPVTPLGKDIKAIETFKAIIKDPDSSPKQIANARKMLDKWGKTGAVSTKTGKINRVSNKKKKRGNK